MKPNLEAAVNRWFNAGLLDRNQQAAIRQWEDRQRSPNGLDWPVLLALAFGVVLVGGGILLFVSAHWENLSPSQRFTIVAVLVAIFHIAAASVRSRWADFSTALHGIGTVALGAGIFLAGQIFHLDAHWSGGILLWALGAAIAYWLLRDWVQLTMAALLVPAWLAGEWSELYPNEPSVISFGLFLTAVVYLGAGQRSLNWVGCLALIPTAFFISMHDSSRSNVGWAAAAGFPLLASFYLGKQLAWKVATAMLFGMGVAFSPNLVRYAIYAVMAVALIWWGTNEGRKERINLGIAGFAINVLVFYFSSVMDKMGRSVSLIALGLLFLLGGYALERWRRDLIRNLETPQ